MARHPCGALRDRDLLQGLVIGFRTRPEGFKIGRERLPGRDWAVAHGLAKAGRFPQATERGFRRTGATGVRWHPR
jgi:hypothetical protein